MRAESVGSRSPALGSSARVVPQPIQLCQDAFHFKQSLYSPRVPSPPLGPSFSPSPPSGSPLPYLPPLHPSPVPRTSPLPRLPLQSFILSLACPASPTGAFLTSPAFRSPSPSYPSPVSQALRVSFTCFSRPLLFLPGSSRAPPAPSPPLVPGAQRRRGTCPRLSDAFSRRGRVGAAPPRRKRLSPQIVFQA
ncbi:vegetative cell wall protein gp1-like [Penaeus chinensis]|uniref:vegetative cell wall protein gp1-like n=1 Tax=Penaeus chinensis TaxID=139456 RepID=UPI001FB7CA79|nr:vegetative cell wall protein gp1-like [Penaeus chinensis]